MYIFLSSLHQSSVHHVVRLIFLVCLSNLCTVCVWTSICCITIDTWLFGCSRPNMRSSMATGTLPVFCKCLEIGNTHHKTPDDPCHFTAGHFHINTSCFTKSCTEFLAIGVADRCARCVLANIAQKFGGLFQTQFAQVFAQIWKLELPMETTATRTALQWAITPRWSGGQWSQWIWFPCPP